MKTLLAIVAALTLTVGAGFGAKQVSDQAGNPPIGGFAPEEAYETATILDVVEVIPTANLNIGNPPIGG
jgi:hypothetical protein